MIYHWHWYEWQVSSGIASLCHQPLWSSYFFLRKCYLSTCFFFFFFRPLCCLDTLLAAEAAIMALLCPVGLSSRARQVLQQKAVVKLASVGPSGDSKQQAGQVKWHHISQRVPDSCCVLSGCVQSGWLWVISHPTVPATGSLHTMLPERGLSTNTSLYICIDVDFSELI